MAIQDQQLQVLLALRHAPPHAGRWALPGGVVRIDLDARAAWALSVVYRTLVPTVTPTLAPGKRIDALAWRSVDEAMHDGALAFDHGALIERAAAALRDDGPAELAPGFAPAAFSLGDLQLRCEQVPGRPPG